MNENEDMKFVSAITVTFAVIYTMYIAITTKGHFEIVDALLTCGQSFLLGFVFATVVFVLQGVVGNRKKSMYCIAVIIMMAILLLL